MSDDPYIRYRDFIEDRFVDSFVSKLERGISTEPDPPEPPRDIEAAFERVIDDFRGELILRVLQDGDVEAAKRLGLGRELIEQARTIRKNKRAIAFFHPTRDGSGVELRELDFREVRGEIVFGKHGTSIFGKGNDDDT